MGYETKFKITVTDNTKLKALAKALETVSGYGGWFETDDLDITIEAKWYDWHKDLKKVSKNKTLKDVVIQVDGEGEESGDVWRWYFKNGKDQDAEAKLTITYQECKL